MRIPKAIAVAFALFIGGTGFAVSEGTLSTSNQSTAGFSSQIVTLLGLETSALRRVPSGRLSELASSPQNSKKRVWVWGKRQNVNTEVDHFPHTNATLAALKTAHGGRQWKCLTDALYFEARGESVKGQFAVAEVILNRAESARFPDTVCGVVYQGASRGKYACQFSYMCDGKSEKVTDKAVYKKLGKISRLMLDGEARILTKGATFYHADWVSPKWAKSFTETAQIGDHVFYRDPQELSSR